MRKSNKILRLGLLELELRYKKGPIFVKAILKKVTFDTKVPQDGTSHTLFLLLVHQYLV